MINNPPGWGDIREVLAQPPRNVDGASSWASVVGAFLTFPILVFNAIVATACKCVFVMLAIGPACCSCWSPLASTLRGNPYSLAWTWWSYFAASSVALIANGGSRLAMFIWEWKAFGMGDYWWHFEALWFWKYQDVHRVLKSQQQRAEAFGGIKAVVPDIFASGILIFLSTGGPQSEWMTIRTALHDLFLSQGTATYQHRMSWLRPKIAEQWPRPVLTDFNDKKRLMLFVAKCIFFMMFGIWLDDSDAAVLTGWRSLAGVFVPPRFGQRAAFNVGVRKVKKLRAESVGLVEKHGLQPLFMELNSKLGGHRRKTGVKLCDEVMFIAGFAGIGGTSACVESVGKFLQAEVPSEAPAHLIDFGGYRTSEDMVRAYKQNPEAYIRETCRLDPPVTSACAVLQEPLAVELAGRPFGFAPGVLTQYVLAMANRDETVFPRSSVFDPTRENLYMALTWNGAFGGGVDENQYPRICPGRHLSLAVARAVVDHVVLGGLGGP